MKNNKEQNRFSMIQQQDIYFLTANALTRFTTSRIALKKSCFSLMTQKKQQQASFTLCQKILTNYQFIKPLVQQIYPLDLSQQQNSTATEINQYFLYLVIIFDYMVQKQFPDRRRRLDKLTRNSISLIKQKQDIIDQCQVLCDQIQPNKFDDLQHIQYFRIRNEKYQKCIQYLDKNKIQYQTSEFKDVIQISTDYAEQLQYYGEFQSISSTLPVRCIKQFCDETLNKSNGKQIKTVLDLCAAPGSKTIQLLDNGFKIYANELNSIRFKALKQRLEQYFKLYQQRKQQFCNLYNMDGIKLLSQFNENDNQNNQEIMKSKPDCVLIDPTCSGSGNESLDEQYAQILELVSQENQLQNKDAQLERLSKFQKKIVSVAMDAKIQYIVYSTCSVNKEENEDVVKYLLDQYQNYKLANVMPQYQQRSSIYNETISAGKQGQEGFYVAMFQLQ